MRSILSLGLIAMLAGPLIACRPKPARPSAPRAPEVIAAAGAAAAVDGPTLAVVRARGRVNCGVVELPGFAYRDVIGQWRGFDVDICRAVAAAVLGDARQVRYVADNSKTPFAALQSGQVDLLARAGAWTYSRDVGLGLDFAGVSYYDGQGFLAPKSRGLRSAADIKTQSICVMSGGTAELNLSDYLKAGGLKAKPVVMETEDDALKAYQDGTCEVLSADISTLAALRSTLRNPNSHIILPDMIAKEPTGPIVRQGDDQWADIVRWTLNAMILAEELGVDSRSVEQARAKPTTPEVNRLLNGEGYGEMMRLRDDWAFQVLRQVGDYSEVFEHNIGPDTDLGLARDKNALWDAEKPGLLFAPPLR